MDMRAVDGTRTDRKATYWEKPITNPTSFNSFFESLENIQNSPSFNVHLMYPVFCPIP
jgi:hypothetical protein